jgi:hypothetical protein
LHIIFFVTNVIMSDAEGKTDAGEEVPVESEILHRVICGEIPLTDPSVTQVIVKYGVPPSMRRALWRVAAHIERKQPQGGLNTSLRETYDRLKAHVFGSEIAFESGTCMEFAREKIRIDLPRTLCNHPILESVFHAEGSSKMEELASLLTIFAFFRPSLGYVQGMAYIAGIILWVMEDEAESFWVFVHWMHVYKLDESFSEGIPAVHGLIAFVASVIRSTDRELFDALSAGHVELSVFLPRWACSLWVASTIPFDKVVHLWDVFAVRGFEFVTCACCSLMLLSRGAYTLL